MIDIEGMARRITAVVGLYKKKSEAAETAGVTTQSLRSYVSGLSEGAFSKIAKLAMEKGVSLEWLATGEGEMLLKDEERNIRQKRDDSHPLDVETLELAIETTEQGLESIGKTLIPSKKAELVKLVYRLLADHSAGEKVKQNNVVDLFKTIKKFG